MAILILGLGAILFAAGFGSLAYSVDLVPTEMGRLYAECGVILISSSAVVSALAAVIAKLNRIFSPPQRKAKAPAQGAAPGVAPQDGVNLNRSGHLPSAPGVGDALAEPEAGPRVVGRYSAGGVQYVIYSDGAIEAETDAGGMRFASMDDLKAYIAEQKG
jgi:hypothetical protein